MRDLPGYGDPSTWGPCINHPNDPRTEDGPDRYEWEADNDFTDYLDTKVIDEILNELLHGDADTARATLDKAVDARFERWIVEAQRQAEEDIAAARTEDRRAA